MALCRRPGGKGEDPSGGFDLEGWTAPYFDEVMGEEMDKQMTPPFDLLLGRKTYDIFASYWPQQGENDPFKESKKYVVSNGEVKTDWEETIQIKRRFDCGNREVKTARRTDAAGTRKQQSYSDVIGK